MKNKLLLLCALCILLPSLAWAKNFGLKLDQKAGGAGTDESFEAEYLGSLIPSFSSLIGDNGELYISMGFDAEYENKETAFFPELLLSRFIWNFGSWNISAGRMYYSDPLSLIAEGLFDGMRVSFNTSKGIFSAGLWYTGLLYKRRANISMNSKELESCAAVLAYKNFADTYFAPRRLISALDWEHPGLWKLSNTQLSFLCQYDLTGENLHSQYLTAKLSLPVNAFLFNLGGSLELIESSDDTKIALAGELGASWTPPTPFPSRLSFLARISAGQTESRGVFLPLTTVPQGSVLEARFSGITMLSLDYTARLHSIFSASLSSSYFIRNDHATYNCYLSGPGQNGYLLGNEFFARLNWSPLSDIAAIFGAGVFLPSMGDVSPNASNLWRITLNVIISLY